jgi:hypothetical protein
MKNAAKCDKSCELQISVNHRIFERSTHFWVFNSKVCLFECHYNINIDIKSDKATR